jgi:hypothetical protein
MYDDFGPGGEMRKQSALILVVILLACVATGNSQSSPTKAELSAITARGRMLAEYDQAAWHSTDAVVAMKPAEGSVERYIAKKNGDRWIVAYGRLSAGRDKFLVAYEATQGANPSQFTVKAFDPPREDTGFYVVGAKAIDLALNDFQRENRPYNTMVLPASSDQMYVYVVPAQTVAGVYPLGGDMRYLISSDGNTVLEKRQLHKSIIEFDTRKVTHAVAGYHTHVLSDVPEDTDVFHVLRQEHPVPEYVAVSKTVVYVVQVDGTIVRAKM